MLGLAMIYPALMHSLEGFALIHFAIGMGNLVPLPPLDGWVALVELCAIRNKAVNENILRLASRLGSGMVYGLGFWYVGKLLVRLL